MMAELKRAHDETPWWVRLSVLLVGGILCVLMLTVLYFTNQVKEYEQQNRANSIAACERGNEARVADVRNLNADIERLNAHLASIVRDAVNLQRYLPAAQSWIDVKLTEARALKHAIEDKRLIARDKLAAVEPYAVSEGSPLADCERAYPK